MIPRHLHQIFLTGALPDRLADNVAAIRALNPGWSHTLYSAASAEAFIAAEYGPTMLAHYLRIDPAYGAARADLLRHLILYKQGGVYLDIKSTLSKPLDDVLQPDDAYVVMQWRNGVGEPEEGYGLHRDLAHVSGGEYITHCLIAEAGHPFTKAAIDQIVANVARYRPWSAVGRTGVLRTTGPIAYTLAVHPLSAPHRLASEAEIGSALSLQDYDHSATFATHYSTLRNPVVKLGVVGRLASGAFVKLREIKTRVTD